MFKNAYIFIKTTFGSHTYQEYAGMGTIVKILGLHDLSNFRYLNFMADFRLNTLPGSKSKQFYLLLQKFPFPMRPHFSTIPSKVNALRVIMCRFTLDVNMSRATPG